MRVVNHLADHRYPRVANAKLVRQRFKSTVRAAMTETSLMKHVERHAMRRHPILWRKRESRFQIDEPPNQPGRRAAIHARPRPRDPSPILVVLRIDVVRNPGLGGS